MPDASYRVVDSRPRGIDPLLFQSALKVLIMAGILDQIQWRSDLLLAGRYDDLARFYAHPLPIHFGKARILIQSHQELRDYFRCFHQVIMRHGIRRLTAHQKARELPRQNRFRLWITWENPEPAKGVASQMDTLYYCNTHAGDMQVEMIQYTRLFAPELLPLWQDQRRSA